MKTNSSGSQKRTKKSKKGLIAGALALVLLCSGGAITYYNITNGQSTKDYIFDLSRFTSFEGNTGPYILYTIVRIKSILNKYGKKPSGVIRFTGEKAEKDIMMQLSRFSEVIETAYHDLAPHKICAYIYELANAFNGFYHEIRILAQENEKKKESYISLLDLTRRILEQCIDLLGFSAPDRM